MILCELIDSDLLRVTWWVLLGVPFYLTEDLMPMYDGNAFTQFVGLLRPFALLAGMISFSMLILHGAAWLSLRASSVMAIRAREIGTWASVVAKAAQVRQVDDELIPAATGVPDLVDIFGALRDRGCDCHLPALRRGIDGGHAVPQLHTCAHEHAHGRFHHHSHGPPHDGCGHHRCGPAHAKGH